MKIEQWLELGEEAAPAVETVLEDAGQLFEDAEQKVAPEIEKLFDEAKSAIAGVKASGVAGTNVGKVAANFVDDLTTAWANAKEALGGDVTGLISAVQAGEAQTKLLTAQLAGGNDVTKQPA